MKKKFKNLIIDVDGVMTDGKFYYSQTGKVMKVFGADDNDALCILKDYINIIFITGDKKGFKISKKRIQDHMGFKIFLVSTIKRLQWMKEKYNLKECIYIGDGIFDSIIMSKVGYSLAPKNADEKTRQKAKKILTRNGGDRAVAEACIFILGKFFKVQNVLENLKKNKKFSGDWSS